MRTILATMD